MRAIIRFLSIDGLHDLRERNFARKRRLDQCRHPRNATEGPLPEVDPRPGLRWTAQDIRSRNRLDAAQRALPISTGLTRGSEERSHMHGQSFNDGRPR